MGNNSSFISGINDKIYDNKSVSVLEVLFHEYERVIVRSLITSFGFDVFIKDQYGGDVDTIHNVRLVGEDTDMYYKDDANRLKFENQGIYKHSDVTKEGTNFQKIKKEAREKFHEDNHNTITDAYENKALWMLGNSKNAPSDINADLDHVIAVKDIYDDRGRVLAGLSLEELADDKTNLKWTNAHLNRSMQDADIPEYIVKHPELPDDVKSRMMDAYTVAKNKYETTINDAYYHSKQFYRASATAALNRGIQMGLRQAVGIILAELWFAIKDEIVKSDQTLEETFEAVKRGTDKWRNYISENYSELFESFGHGALSGIVSSITTTLLNTFITTSETINKIIREVWASVVEAVSILLFDKEEAYFCDRMSNAAKVLAAGAIVVIGTTVQERVSLQLKEVPIHNEIKSIIATFAGSFTTGVLSVSLLFYIDYNPFDAFLDSVYGAQLVALEKQRSMFQEYCAQLRQIDIDRLEHDAEYMKVLSERLSEADDNEVNVLLRKAQNDLGLESPWGEGSLDDKMNDKDWVLKF